MKKLTAAFFSLLFLSVNAQTTLTLPRESQYSSVIQRIGITDITVIYHSPAVKGRKIFGDLVPYDTWWRAGANENTTIKFTSDVTIEKQKLAAGIYGLHMIPGKDSWTIIFSNNSTSWGSFFYKKEEDALRVVVKPNEHAFTEWLTYEFVNKAATSATLSLLWDKLEVPVRIDVDVKNVVLASIRNELRSSAAFSWNGWYDAAQFCYENNINTDEALTWVERANRMNPGDFQVTKLKASLLRAKGENKQADAIMYAIIADAKEGELNGYGYELLNQNKTQEAIKIFQENVKRHPKSWNAYDSLAEALAKAGDKTGSVKQYEQALKMAPDDQKQRIETAMQLLK